VERGVEGREAGEAGERQERQRGRRTEACAEQRVRVPFHMQVRERGLRFVHRLIHLDLELGL
jgi:hypothetical protein